MEPKTTDELKNEIRAATDIEDYPERNRSNMLTVRLPECLKRVLEQKGISKADFGDKRGQTKIAQTPGGDVGKARCILSTESPYSAHMAPPMRSASVRAMASPRPVDFRPESTV